MENPNMHFMMSFCFSIFGTLPWLVNRDWIDKVAWWSRWPPEDGGFLWQNHGLNITWDERYQSDSEEADSLTLSRFFIRLTMEFLSLQKYDPCLASFFKAGFCHGAFGPTSVIPVLKNGFWAVWKMLGRDYITDFIFTITDHRFSTKSISHFFKYNVILVGGFKHVVFFHSIWDNPSHGLSYFSEGLKPPTSKYHSFILRYTKIQYNNDDNNNIIIYNYNIPMDPNTVWEGSHHISTFTPRSDRTSWIPLRSSAAPPSFDEAVLPGRARCQLQSLPPVSCGITCGRRDVGKDVAGDGWKLPLVWVASLDGKIQNLELRKRFQKQHFFSLLNSSKNKHWDFKFFWNLIWLSIDAQNPGSDQSGGRLSRSLGSVIILGHGVGLDACYILNYTCR